MNFEELAQELVQAGCEMARARNNSCMNELAKGEFFVLNILNKSDSGLNSKIIAKELNVTSARVASIVNQLEKKQDVCRLPDSKDHRQIIVQLTDHGKMRLDEKIAEVQAAAIDLIYKIGIEDAMEYLRIQKRIIE